MTHNLMNTHTVAIFNAISVQISWFMELKFIRKLTCKDNIFVWRKLFFATLVWLDYLKRVKPVLS